MRAALRPCVTEVAVHVRALLCFSARTILSSETRNKSIAACVAVVVTLPSDPCVYVELGKHISDRPTYVYSTQYSEWHVLG